tara:strand:+ start:747 stop:959 length:213 start_codon:yes stop_codon:yes gene_type:complete
MKNYLLNGLEVADFEVDGINMRDYPDFCDAFISDASVLENGKWRDATDLELDALSDDSDLVYAQVEKHLY